MNKDKILKNDNLEICFKAFDSDNSGKISLDEISAIFSNGDKEKMNKEEIEALKKMIGDADANGDGEISFKEFKDLMRKFFL